MDEFKKNIFLQEEAYKNHLSRLTSYPSLLTLPVSNSCDLKCIMCGLAQHPDQYKLTLNEESYQRLKVLFPYLEKIELVGAELYAQPESSTCLTDRIVEWAHTNKHLKLYGFSHAMNIGSRRAADIVNKFGSLSISLDSHRNNIFESIRVGADFEKFLSNISTIVKEKERRRLGPNDMPRLQFAAVIMRRNYKDLPDLVRLVSQLGGVFLSVRPLQKDVNDEVWETLKKEDLFTESEKCLEFLELLKQAQKIADELGITLHDQTQDKISAIFSQPSKRPSKGPKRKLKYCDVPWYNFFVRSNGVVTFDFCSRKILGNINEDSVDEIWNGKAARGERSLFIDGFYGHCYRNCRNGFETGLFSREKRGMRRVLALGKK